MQRVRTVADRSNNRNVRTLHLGRSRNSRRQLVIDELEGSYRKALWPGTRVAVFDSSLFKDDISTPLSYTVRPATVTCWYGYVSEYMEREYGREAAIYPDMIDVIFDHRPERVSRGHFSDGVELI